MSEEDIGNLRAFLDAGYSLGSVHLKDLQSRIDVVASGHHQQILDRGGAGITLDLLVREEIGHLVRKGQFALVYLGEMKYEEYLCKLETAAKGGMLDGEYNKEKQNLDYIGKHIAKTEEIRLKTQASRQALERAYLEIKAKYGETANRSKGKSAAGHGKDSSLTKICPVCGTEYAEGYNFCVKKQCAAEGKSSELIYAWKCRACGADLAESITRHGAIKHCPDCGAKLPEKQAEAINKNAAKPAKEENPGRYCRKCNKKYTGDEEMCPVCGSLLAELKCGKCGSKYIKDKSGKYNKYCPECGKETIFAEKKLPKSEPKPEEKPEAKPESDIKKDQAKKISKWPVIITAALLLCIGTWIYIGNKASNAQAQKIAQLEKEKAEAEQKAVAEAEQRKKAEQEAATQRQKAEEESASRQTAEQHHNANKAETEHNKQDQADKDIDAFEECKEFYYSEKYYFALSWCKKAAEQGNKQAAQYVGDMYKYGKGVLKNNSEALRWYDKAGTAYFESLFMY